MTEKAENTLFSHSYCRSAAPEMTDHMTHTIHIEPHNIDIVAEHGSPLKEIIGKYGIDFPCGGKGLCGNCHVEILSGNMATSDTEQALLKRKGLDGKHWRIACLGHVTEDLSIRIPQREQVILSDNEGTARKGEEGFAVAVDLGSTTIVAQLIDRMDGTVKETFSEINEQNSYGADIISRIAYAIQGQEYLDKLMHTVRSQIGRMISAMTASAGTDDIRNVTLVGNSVMHHLFCGIDVTPLSAYPFQSEHNGKREFSPDELQWKLPESCVIQFMPNISHFVGSDILAGIFRLGIHRSSKWTALMDLGTNGEIVIGNREKILCTSTAAGPAFEGVNITNGMRAVSGAVCRIDAKTGAAETIGNASPAGICGSGLIDAIHYFIKTGQITSDGRIADESLHSLPIAGNVALYDRDIREFQLAKAAIATGFDLLVRQLGIRLEDIGTIYIAGGLGNWLDIGKAREIGLVKAVGDFQVSKAGNSALAGCREMTFASSQQEIEEIMPLLSHYSLETDPAFQDEYCNNLFF